MKIRLAVSVVLLTLFALVLMVVAKRKNGEEVEKGPGKVVPTVSAEVTFAPAKTSITSEASVPKPRTLVYPEWYNSRLIDVPLSSLDNGVDPRIGARTRVLARGGQGLSLRIKFRNLGRCMPGDLDIISYDFKVNPAADLLLTIEPLEGESTAPSVRSRLTLELISKEGSLDLTLPLLNEAGVYGIYLCRDSNKSGSCRGTAALLPDRLEQRNERSKDRLYYFNPVVLERENITLVKQPSKNDDYYRLLAGYIGNKLASEGRASELVKKIENLNTSIGSGSIQLEGADLVIDLPKADQATCEELLRLNSGR